MKFYTHARRDLFETRHGVILHGCNCAGGFGSGVAGQMKKKYPQVAEAFYSVNPDPASLGTIQIVKINDVLTVVNGFTQVTMGLVKKRYADPLAIQSVLNKTLQYAIGANLDIFMPKIGCGLAGLSWELDVEPIVDTIARKADLDGVRIILCDKDMPAYMKEKPYRG